jgi:predicted O-methyltransferase YrrM
MFGSQRIAHLVFRAKYPRYYGKLHAYLDIDGWLGYKEAVYLYEAAQSMEGQDPTVVEIGTWLGKSAIVLGKALQDRKNARVICIDPFNADGDRDSRRVYQRIRGSMNQTLEEACLQNIIANGVDRVVQLIKGYSYDVVLSWNQPIDFLFIDGNHEYAAVRRDFDDWRRFLVRGGLLVMDDVYPSGKYHEGPNRVVRESVANHPDWYAGLQVGTLYSARKR